jgi:hypothetical protein
MMITVVDSNNKTVVVIANGDYIDFRVNPVDEAMLASFKHLVPGKLSLISSFLRMKMVREEEVEISFLLSGPAGRGKVLHAAPIGCLLEFKSRRSALSPTNGVHWEFLPPLKGEGGFLTLPNIWAYLPEMGVWTTYDTFLEAKRMHTRF